MTEIRKSRHGDDLRVRYRGHVCAEAYTQPTTNKLPKGNRTWKLTK